MSDYYLYHLHPNGRVASREDLHAEDDDNALAQANLSSDTGPMELWQGARLVKAFPARPPTDL